MKVSVKFWICTPAWDTEIVRVGAPVAVTVIVPERALVPALAEALIVNEPLFVPLDGVTVNHEVALLVTLQVLLEVTVIFAVLATDARFQVVWDRLSVAA